MKTVLYISILLIAFLSEGLVAQGTVTSTMRISATVVSGVTLSNVESINVDLENGERSGGSFNFTTPSYLDSQVDIENDVVLRNEFGDEIRISSQGNHQFNDGKHQVNFNTEIEPLNSKLLKGNYQGNLTTTINYL
ncbi:MAG: hypothetical protein ACMZ7B_12600 [Balneola sp.]